MVTYYLNDIVESSNVSVFLNFLRFLIVRAIRRGLWIKRRLIALSGTIRVMINIKRWAYLRGRDCSVKNFGFLACTITTSNKSLQSSPTKYCIPLLLLQKIEEEDQVKRVNRLELKLKKKTYTNGKGLFVTRKSFLFALTNRSKNCLMLGVASIYSFVCSPTILCITGWLEPMAFYWETIELKLFQWWDPSLFVDTNLNVSEENLRVVIDMISVEIFGYSAH